MDSRLVQDFLNEFLTKLSINGKVDYVGRDKNQQALADLEISPSYRSIVLKDLKIEDYSEGPLNNNQYGNNPMWVFGKEVKGFEVYIKITCTENAICISFHIAERPMNYPLKKI